MMVKLAAVNDRRIETCWSIIPGLASLDYGNHHYCWFIRCVLFQNHAFFIAMRESSTTHTHMAR